MSLSRQDTSGEVEKKQADRLHRSHISRSSTLTCSYFLLLLKDNSSPSPPGEDPDKGTAEVERGYQKVKGFFPLPLFPLGPRIKLSKLS